MRQKGKKVTKYPKYFFFLINNFPKSTWNNLSYHMEQNSRKNKRHIIKICAVDKSLILLVRPNKIKSESMEKGIS